MLSKRLRKRLRQIDTGADTSPKRPEANVSEAPDNNREAIRIGAQSLSRRRARASEGDARSQPSGPDRPPRPEYPRGPLEELAPGEAIEAEEGSYWLVARPASEMLPHGADILTHFGRLTELLQDPRGNGIAELRGARPSELVLLDTETAGLSSAPVFLVGLVIWESDAPHDAVSLQMLARDYAEERAVLAASAELLADRRVLMTYNGKSFDLPMMRERMVYHGLGECPELPHHVDMLHIIRARFRDSWENCRLQTVEQKLCGRSRWGDIEGSEIPDAYHDFVHTGEAGRIAQVLEHNRLDLITMLEVLPHLQETSEAQ